MMNRNNENRTVTIAHQVIAAIAALFLLSLFLSVRGAAAENLSTFDMDNWNGESVILEDPQYFMEIEDDPIPVISSVGKKNVKIRGVQSKYKLVNYTIPEQLLRADPDFLALMVEAEKYIGYPYVYGASNPDTGFDCSGYVCWVFSNSGVCDVGRMGANGLYSLCSDVSKEDARPGDLVFFEKTMGADVKGITHVGIYVGNDMMIHAGDPVGFADLKSEKWSKRLYGFGRLPID
ncbi:MAG: C40 family peptidase [Aristaeellaceae bacterium]